MVYQTVANPLQCTVMSCVTSYLTESDVTDGNNVDNKDYNIVALYHIV